jgi:GGDEF domain-containing protein
MAADWTVLYHDPQGEDPPELLRRFASAREIELLSIDSDEAVIHQINRALPAALILRGEGEGIRRAAFDLCERIKSDAFTSILPVAMLLPGGTEAPGQSKDPAVIEALERGADEAVPEGRGEIEGELRLDLLIRRATRDIAVHPTTRLPGTPQIERDTWNRIRRGEPFAFCYADLDHFKEFNDRYGYNRGDRVIYLVSLVLRDLVRGLAPGGFVGHIGGDDFVFTVPLDRMETVCDEILDLFDEIMPYQYSESDRDAGYFLGRDRRGALHRVPLMTLSIGVVTNLAHTFRHPAQVSSRAGEMKSYAKTLPGSVYVVDRRHGKPHEGRGQASATVAAESGAANEPEPRSDAAALGSADGGAPDANLE